MRVFVQSQRNTLSKAFDFAPECLVAEAAERAAIDFGYGHGMYTFGVKVDGCIDPINGKSRLQDVLRVGADVWIVFTGSIVGA